jgi:sugar phosphate isomerase/epimerase
MPSSPSSAGVLWSVGLLGYPFRERVRVAAEQGYADMSANAWELEDELVRGGVPALRELRDVADQHGIRLSVLEPALTWLPPTPGAALRRVELEQLEIIGEVFGIDALLAIA